MVEKKITRKVIKRENISKALAGPKKTDASRIQVNTNDGENEAKHEGVKSKKVCQFCQNKTTPSYTDIAVLRHFVTDRAKIVPKLKSNLCSKHQRSVTKQIKYARHLALLSFTPKV